jgi:gamma-glutamylcyclotransferase (GGCT)/AIG2-like uncharacterized protein YtfP
MVGGLLQCRAVLRQYFYRNGVSRMHNVVVYGSLRQGFGNHGLLTRHKARFVGFVMTPPEYTMLHLGGFPGLIRSGETAIKCELYEVSDRCLLPENAG